jgi:hypothetical protein
MREGEKFRSFDAPYHSYDRDNYDTKGNNISLERREEGYYQNLVTRHGIHSYC